jgi:hypothetical protein
MWRAGHDRKIISRQIVLSGVKKQYYLFKLHDAFTIPMLKAALSRLGHSVTG